jgi:hypothetical protein
MDGGKPHPRIEGAVEVRRSTVAYREPPADFCWQPTELVNTITAGSTVALGERA